MSSNPSGRRRRLGAAAVAALLLIAGVNSAGPMSVRDVSAATTLTPASVPSGSVPTSPVPSAPVPASPETAAPVPASSPSSSPSSSVPDTDSTAPNAQPKGMPESVPETLRIPSIRATSKLIRLGLDNQGALTVPSGAPGSPAGWYEYSPTPGETGPAVLLGHVNAEGGGPGIFADLRRLSPGDRIEVGRKDGRTAVFTVLRGEQYPKDEFPTQKVYGNTAGPQLRLITCDGFDPKTGHFEDNYVVYAELVPDGGQ